jgi:hypothetical protein
VACLALTACGTTKTVQSVRTVTVTVAATAAATTSAPPAHTLVRTYGPFTPSGLSPSIKVKARGTGSCFAASMAVEGDPAAYRCNVGNELFDPCFESPVGPASIQLACTNAPWSPVELLTVTQPLPTADPQSADGPEGGWACNWPTETAA